MLNNNLNNKSSSENLLNIVIKLTKSKDNNSYVYVGDSLQDSSKIKIPIDIPIKKEGAPKGRRPNPPTINLNNVNINNSTNNYNYNNAFTINNNIDIDSEPDIELEPEVKETYNELEKANNKNVIIPSCTQWFNFADIHEIEMNSLPEYFCGKYPSKTPTCYKEYRNFMISLYRENPSCYLSSTSRFYLKVYLNFLYFNIIFYYNKLLEET